MGKRKTPLAPGEFYHIYHRGMEKRKIFIDDNDYRRFIALLYLCNNPNSVQLSDWWDKPYEQIFSLKRRNTLVDIGSYCLMPNHFHILIYEKMEKGISTFMQKLSTSYSMYFNLKYTRTGGLFERPFKSQHVSTDNHLKYLFAYIHLNPVKVFDSETWEKKIIFEFNSAKKFIENYRYSSFLDYSKDKQRPRNVILNKKSFPKYFSTTKDFNDFIDDWMLYSEESQRQGDALTTNS